jgi:hypothetical protein
MAGPLPVPAGLPPGIDPTKPITREQLNNLPKETRESILKATGGKIPAEEAAKAAKASPSPSPQKKN